MHLAKGLLLSERSSCRLGPNRKVTNQQEKESSRPSGGREGTGGGETDASPIYGSNFRTAKEFTALDLPYGDSDLG